MSQVYLSQFSRRAGFAETASYALNGPTASVALPGGQDTQIQFNSGGLALSGSPNFTYNYTASIVTLTGSLITTGSLVVSGTVFFPGLITGSQPYVVTYNSESGQLFYATASAAVFEVQDEGTIVTSAATILNFTGSGVTASLNGNVVDVYIPSSSGAILLNNLLTNITVGGSDAGTLYDAGTLLETILRDILTDYLDPTITFKTLKLGGTVVFDSNNSDDLFREVSSSLTFNITNFAATADNPGGRFPYSSSFTASGATIGNFTYYFGDDVLATDNTLGVGASRTINRASPGPVTFTIQGTHPSSSTLPNIKDDAILTYVYPIYYGMSTVDYSTSPNNLESNVDLTKDVVAKKSTQDILLNGVSKFIYFAFPDNWGSLSSIKDLNTGFEYLGSSPAFINYIMPNQSGSVSAPWVGIDYKIYQYHANYPNGTNVNSHTYRFTFA
jgi:hypothetical protein